MTLVIGVVVFFVAEIYVLVRVASAIGTLPCVLLLLAVSACGPWLVRRAGLGVWRRARLRLAEGEVPGRELLDGLLLLAAGVCITVPGFITDAIGVLLLLPPVRLLARRVVVWRLGRRMTVVDHAGRVMRRSRRGSVVSARSHARRDDRDLPSLTVESEDRDRRH